MSFTVNSLKWNNVMHTEIKQGGVINSRIAVCDCTAPGVRQSLPSLNVNSSSVRAFRWALMMHV